MAEYSIPEENIRLYEQARVVPPEAIKQITAGRLKGFSDINPMYRIKRLTEMFGPCGIGWWYVIKDKKLVEDPGTHQWAAFVDIDLFYVDPVSGEVSHAIPGTGGASFVANEKNGPYMSDECFKMALTDAISVSAKAIGVAADVYYAKDRTKYTAPSECSPPSAAQKQQRASDKVSEAKKNPLNMPPKNNVNPATDEQKKILRSLVNLEQLQDCNTTYGENWEKMPASHAAALIKKLQG